MNDTYKLIAIVIIAGVLTVVVFIMFSCFMGKKKKKKLQLQQQPQTPQWLRGIVSAPTYQPRNIDVESDGFRSKSDTIVKKSLAPIKPFTVDGSSRYQATKRLERVRGNRDDGSAFGGGCGGSGGGDSGCGGSHCGGGGGCG
ncbi:PREDICTED: uncharacterized protein LOC104758714 [Camelina sativa]|uniref:Uncharacterized protein LOC104758714 n=1 Tax=Camelina sativa TaxID=90675 RepID=A0ABM0X373_CAMSA|nr:PREDICTED: uncharacterized protein LOC104758714 [Camelina sativa]